MSLKFNEALKILSEGLPKPSKPEHKLYIQDAVEISEIINQELINMNSIFKGSVSNWEDTCTYLPKDLYKIWIPFLCINMPFEVEPEQVKPHPFRAFKLKTSANHPAVEKGYVNGIKLTRLFFWDINEAIKRLGKVSCRSGNEYNCLPNGFYEIDGKQYFKILVKENEAQEAPSILYQFNISFTFAKKSQHYLFFFDFFHQSERSNLKAMATNISEMVNKIIMLLLQLHLDSSLTVEKMHNITTYAISHSKEHKFEEILLEAIPHFIPFLKNPGPLMCAHGKLLQLKQADSVQVSELKEVFGIQ